MTFFDTLSRSYVDVDLTKGIDTEQFLEATEGLVKLFGKLFLLSTSIFFFIANPLHCLDLLGSKAFAVVQNDMNGNIKVNRCSFRFLKG